MKLELLMKVIDRETSDEDEASRIAKRVISGEEDEPLKFTYRPYTFDLRDVVCHGQEDDDHTKIMMPYGIFYGKIEYNLFSTIYNASLGTTTKTLNDFKLSKR